jgi:hypothetical protein
LQSRKIAYRLKVFTICNSNYANARTYGIQSAVDLYGAGSPEVIATTNAFYAVGIELLMLAQLILFHLLQQQFSSFWNNATSTNLTWTAKYKCLVTGYNVYRGQPCC